MRQQRGPARLGAPREPDRDLRRFEVEIVADAHHREHAFGLEERIQAVRLVRRDALDVQAEPVAARDVALDHVDVLRPPGHLEAARLRPVQRLSGVLGEPPEVPAGLRDELDHQVAGSRVAHQAGSPRRGLRRDLVLVDDRDVPGAVPDEGERRRGAETAGADHDDVRAVDHGATLPRRSRLRWHGFVFG